MTILTADPDTLAGVLAEARGGDTVRLVGAFADIRLPKVAYAPWLTLDCRKATVGRVLGVSLSGLRIVGGRFAGLKFDGVSNVQVEEATITGDGTGFGVQFLRSRGVASRYCRISGVRVGVGHGYVEGFEASGHAISGVTADGITAGCSRKGLIDGNVIWGSAPYEGAHGDGVQLWSRPDAPPTADIIIRGNAITGDTMGINGFDRPGDGGFDRITVSANRVTVNRPNGMAFINARRLIVTDNAVSTLAGSTYQAKINLTNCPDVERGGNTVAAYRRKPAIIDPRPMEPRA